MRHGSNINPPNRFLPVHAEDDFEHLETLEDTPQGDARKIEYLADATQSIISENDSPDIPFRYSINPYRGCIHGCSYCYARPGHEYLGWSAGLDFETKIVVKQNAAQLLREFLARDSWRPEPIVFSGVTDCYQPAERQFKLTRQCLEVMLECRQPVGIITKNALVARDLDLLQPLAALNLVHVFVSVTTLDPLLAQAMEPRTSTPAARLRTVQQLAEARVPVGVMVAPVIPALNDSEIPSILEAAAQAGAQTAGYTVLRLPLTVEPVFVEWLHRTQPNKAVRVLARIRELRQGRLNNSQWGDRMRGTGEFADQIQSLFRLFKRKFGLDRGMTPQDCSLFVPPIPKSGQLRLF